jgi:diguanylate cyclase (GGDEF)-like protein/PAS domain S-box-containing protein
VPVDKRTLRLARILLGVAAALLAAALMVWVADASADLQQALLDASLVCGAATTLLAAAGRRDRYRVVWGALGIAQVVYALGDIHRDFVQYDPFSFPGVSDLLWLPYYPLVFLGLAFYLLEARSVRPMVWLDGTIVVLVLAAGGFAWILGENVHSASSPAVVGQLLYPILDLTFVAFALVLGYAGRWRLGSAFIAASAAAILLFVTDTVHFDQIADDRHSPGSLVDCGWAGTMLLMSMAAQLTLRRPNLERTSIRGFNAISAAVTIPALLLLVRGTDHPGGRVTVGCAAAAMLLLAIRLMITANENQRLADDNRGIVATAGEGIMRTDAEGRITYANPAACEMVGFRSSELLGKSGHDLLHHSHADGTPYPPEECPIRRVLAGEGPVRVSDEVFWRSDGSSFPVDYTAAPMREEGKSVGVVVVFDDVTVQRTIEERLRYQADHDALSGLYNRRRFIEEVEEQLEYSRRYGTSGALLMLDLDSFKFINDSFGHETGDDLIRGVATLLRERMRASDAVGRLGGDEFAVLLREADPPEALDLARSLSRVIKSSSEPSVDASVGIATFNGSEPLVADDLVVRADIALYEAKQGAGAVAWHGQKSARLTWVGEIREAIEEDRLILYSQPILNLVTDSLEGEELLVRLVDREGNVIPPDGFLPIAERFGLIQDIDRLVVRRAMELARSGRKLAVNLSAHSIGDHEIIRLIADAADSGVDPNNLTFEITETAAVSNLEEARRFAERLARIGCGLALDDFGTGLSSLGYLKHIPAQVLKIDIEFVHGVAKSSIDQYMVETIVGIARRLGQVTVAEGVEDAATLTTLRRFKVDYAQGYYIGRPAAIVDGEARELTSDVIEALAASTPSQL